MGAARREREGPRVLREVPQHDAHGGPDLGHALGRADHDAQGSRRDPRGMARRPAPGRRRPALERLHSSRQVQAARHHEGRRVHEAAGDSLQPEPLRRMTRFWKAFWVVLIGVPLLAFTAWGLQDNPRLFTITLLNGLTLASLYFIVASGFTLVFGLMRNVNLAHGSLYLLGGYLGFFTAQFTGSWLLALAVGFAAAAVVGLAMQVSIFRFMPGQDLRQTLVTIGLAIIIADLLMWAIGAQVHQMDPPSFLHGPVRGIPIINAYASYRLTLIPIGVGIGVLLWLFLNRTRVGMMIRAGVD